MKKILATLCLLCLTSPVFAEVVTTIRAYKELNDICKPTITIHNQIEDLFVCLADNSVNNETIWRSGWSTPVRANLILLIPSYENPRQLSTDQEEVAALKLKILLGTNFENMVKAIRISDKNGKNFDAQMIKELLNN